MRHYMRVQNRETKMQCPSWNLIHNISTKITQLRAWWCWLRISFTTNNNVISCVMIELLHLEPINFSIDPPLYNSFIDPSINPWPNPPSHKRHLLLLALGLLMIYQISKGIWKQVCRSNSKHEAIDNMNYPHGSINELQLTTNNWFLLLSHNSLINFYQ